MKVIHTHYIEFDLKNVKKKIKIRKNRFVKMYLHSICVHIQTCECVTIVDSIPQLVTKNIF